MAVADQNLGLGRLFMRWVNDSVRSRGLFRSVAYLAGQAWCLARDAMPDRRRSRFGDIDYDCDYGMDTTWARLSWGVRLREVLTERLYQPTVPEEFAEIMQHLARVDFAAYTFVDLGSGKGRALLMAAEYPFRRIIGVEVQPELHAIAAENLQKLRQSKPGLDLRLLRADARHFEFPPEPLLLYLFNPFPDYVLAGVLANLRQSVARHPRPVYVVYNAPYEQHIIEGAEFLHSLAQTPKFVIYSAG